MEDVSGLIQAVRGGESAALDRLLAIYRNYLMTHSLQPKITGSLPTIRTEQTIRR